MGLLKAAILARWALVQTAAPIMSYRPVIRPSIIVPLPTSSVHSTVSPIFLQPILWLQH